MVKQLKNKQDLQELTRQGNSKVIAVIINKKLQPKSITAKVSLKKDCLQLMFEAVQAPPQKALVD